MLLILLLPLPVHAGFEEAVSACYSRDHHRNLKGCTKLIERYSSFLKQKDLGKAYWKRGLAKERLIQDAAGASDFEQACDLGEARVCMYLGVHYEFGKDGYPPSNTLMNKFYKKACDLGLNYVCTWVTN